MNMVAAFVGYALPASIIGFWIGYIISKKNTNQTLSRLELALLFVPVWALGAIGVLLGRAFLANQIDPDGSNTGALVAAVLAGWVATSLRILSKRK